MSSLSHSRTHSFTRSPHPFTNSLAPDSYTSGARIHSSRACVVYLIFPVLMTPRISPSTLSLCQWYSFQGLLLCRTLSSSLRFFSDSVTDSARRSRSTITPSLGFSLPHKLSPLTYHKFEVSVSFTHSIALALLQSAVTQPSHSRFHSKCLLSLVHSQGNLETTSPADAKSAKGAANIPRSEDGVTHSDNSATEGVVQGGAEDACNGAENGARVSLSSWEREGLRPLLEVMVSAVSCLSVWLSLHFPLLARAWDP